MMRFSVLIPTFNRAPLLEQAIKSVFAQTYNNIEIIIIDDGSSDHTTSIISKFSGSIQYYRQDNKGKAAALNRGIANSTGDALIVLDDDDLFPPWAIAKHAAALHANPSADFSYGRYIRFKGDEISLTFLETAAAEHVPTLDPRRLVIKLMENCFIAHSAWAIRRHVQIGVGLYNESLLRSQDYDMVLRVAKCSEATFVNDVVLYVRQHEAMRGPYSDRTKAVYTHDKWIKYDALVFNRIDQDWDIAEFRPFSTTFCNDDGEAFLQKGIILFQKKVYESARGLLMSYRDLLKSRPATNVELWIAAGLLGASHGIRDLVEDDTVASWLRSGDWPFLIRLSFALQLRWRVRNALKEKDLDYVISLARFCFVAFGPKVAGVILASSYGRSLGRLRARGIIDRVERGCAAIKRCRGALRARL